MSKVSNEAVMMATKLAAEQLKRSKHDIGLLKETVATQAANLKEATQKERALKLATKLVVGDDVLADIQEKAASLMREDLDIVEKAMDLGLSHGLKIGKVNDQSMVSEKAASNANALVDALLKYANGELN